ncbi:D-lactate dehydrogenase [Diplonema papillatum]|nr:D-lactate dehydrogenase [Diplonema papillatum]|eukprot:gene6026-9258_t
MDRNDVSVLIRRALNDRRLYGTEPSAWSVVTDADLLLRDYSTDRSHHAPQPPLLAVLPTTAAQVSAVAKCCYANDVAMVVRGAGTGLEGGAIPYGPRTVVIDTAGFTAFAVDAANLTCWVGVGVKKLTLNKKLNQVGFLFGPDPSSNPCVGGMASTSGSGMSTVKYGTMRENVVSLRVVTPQGDVVEQTRRPVRKSSTGLELTQLYVGSEGTLGIITEVCVRIHKLQRCHAGGLAVFPTTLAACQAVVRLRQDLRHVGTLVRCELLNRGGVSAANAEYQLNLAVVPTVLLELENDLVEDTERKALRADFEVFAELFRSFGATSCVFHPTRGEMDRAWEARRGCLMAAHKYRRRKGEKVLTTDSCVPLSNLAQLIEATEKDFEAERVPCIICAHIADSNFHCLIPFSNDDERKVAERLESRLCERAVDLGGTVSGEHGVGVGKVRHLLKEHGTVHVGVQQRIKEALDPKGLMNPGKFYPHEQAKHNTAHL